MVSFKKINSLQHQIGTIMNKEIFMDSNVDRFEAIASVVCETLTIEEVKSEQDLIDSGYLDSLALVQLMVALEERFNITISPEEMDIEDYRSVKSISRMITRINQESQEFGNHG